MKWNSKRIGEMKKMKNKKILLDSWLCIIQRPAAKRHFTFWCITFDFHGWAISHLVATIKNGGFAVFKWILHSITYAARWLIFSTYHRNSSITYYYYIMLFSISNNLDSHLSDWELKRLLLIWKLVFKKKKKINFEFLIQSECSNSHETCGIMRLFCC